MIFGFLSGRVLSRGIVLNTPNVEKTTTSVIRGAEVFLLRLPWEDGLENKNVCATLLLRILVTL